MVCTKIGCELVGPPHVLFLETMTMEHSLEPDRSVHDLAATVALHLSTVSYLLGLSVTNGSCVSEHLVLVHKVTMNVGSVQKSFAPSHHRGRDHSRVAQIGHRVLQDRVVVARRVDVVVAKYTYWKNDDGRVRATTRRNEFPVHQYLHSHSPQSLTEANETFRGLKRAYDHPHRRSGVRVLLGVSAIHHACAVGCAVGHNRRSGS